MSPLPYLGAEPVTAMLLGMWDEGSQTLTIPSTQRSDV